MDRIVIVVYFMILFIGINGVSLNIPTSINENTNEIALLIGEFWPFNPAAFLSFKSHAICRFIENCCQDKDRSEAISLMMTALNSGYISSFNFSQVINKCTHTNILIEKDEFCLSLEQFSSLPLAFDEDDNVRQFNNMVNSNDGINTIRMLIEFTQKSCNNYESHAFLCLSEKKLFELCVAKVLQNIHDSMDDIYYNKTITEIKQTLIRVNQQLVEFSVKNTNRN